MAKNFEYKTLYVEFATLKNNVFDITYQNNISDTLNNLGQDGWELITSVPINQGYGWTGMMILIFKRELIEKGEKKWKKKL